jgi:hypothetical protein
MLALQTGKNKEWEMQQVKAFNVLALNYLIRTTL